jgi:branched-chain amino acid transport system ATP-binding protein
MSAPTQLIVEGLVAGYEPGVPIVRGVSVRASEGETVVILGPNGAGKSTLVKAIAGLVPKTAGRVTLGGADITGLPAHMMVRHGLAFVPQTENVFAAMTVADNLALAAAVLPKAERAGGIEEMYALFPDLAAQRRLGAGRLSGGQRQMLAIARALMVKPRLLALDEPSAGLSPKLVELVFARLSAIRASGVTILLVEQNAHMALAIADRAYILTDGLNRLQGKATDLAKDPSIAGLYLGAGPAAGVSLT